MHSDQQNLASFSGQLKWNDSYVIAPTSTITLSRAFFWIILPEALYIWKSGRHIWCLTGYFWSIRFSLTNDAHHPNQWQFFRIFRALEFCMAVKLFDGNPYSQPRITVHSKYHLTCRIPTPEQSIMAQWRSWGREAQVGRLSLPIVQSRWSCPPRVKCWPPQGILVINQILVHISSTASR